MSRIVIHGGKKLKGTVKVSGAKNSVLPIIAATLLSEGKNTIYDAPYLEDVKIILEVIKAVGVDVKMEENTIYTEYKGKLHWEPPADLVKRMRASFLVAGPLLAKLKKVKISLPGGCAIGKRPIDLHLKGFVAMGAEVSFGDEYVEITTDGLKGADIYLDFPSVGATENIMMAASLAEGETIIENAAKEPEIVDLANFLNHMGAKIFGAGTDIIRIRGQKALGGAVHTIIPDRIEAGTFMIAGAITGSEITIQNVVTDHLKPVIAKLREIGTEITETEEGILVKGNEIILPTDIKTLPYPGFPTDLQAQMMALLSVSNGTSEITESVFENRFMHADEFQKMGAQIHVIGRVAVVTGVKKLTGAAVKATDLRAGAALILAGLVAEGKTEVSETYHIDRGYEKIEEKFRSLNADIVRIEE